MERCLIGTHTTSSYIYLYTLQIQDAIKDVLFESLENYKGLGNFDVTTLGWMFFMKEVNILCFITRYLLYIYYIQLKLFVF